MDITSPITVSNLRMEVDKKSHYDLETLVRGFAKVNRWLFSKTWRVADGVPSDWVESAMSDYFYRLGCLASGDPCDEFWPLEGIECPGSRRRTDLYTSA